MPRSATFSVTAASPYSSIHNSREERPKYLISQLIIENNVIDNFYDCRYTDSDFLVQAQAKYKEVKHQKMQQKQIDALIKETVFSLENNHNEKDIQKVFDELAAKYGGHYITELSIHRDEGYFEDENGITYYPTKDIIEKEDGWYIVPLTESIRHSPEYRPKADEFSKKVVIEKFKPIHNIHAHIKFSMFDLITGKTGRMQHKDLKQRIRTAARVLNLEYSPEKKNGKRVTVADKKVQHKAVRNEKVRNFLEHNHTLDAKNLEAEQLRYDLQKAQKQITTLVGIDAEQKQELHRLNTEIKKLELVVKHKDMKIASLEAINETITATEEAVTELKKPVSNFEASASTKVDKSIVEDLRNENNQLSSIITEREKELGLIDGIIEAGNNIDMIKLIRKNSSFTQYGGGYTAGKEYSTTVIHKKLNISKDIDDGEILLKNSTDHTNYVDHKKPKP